MRGRRRSVAAVWGLRTLTTLSESANSLTRWGLVSALHIASRLTQGFYSSRLPHLGLFKMAIDDEAVAAARRLRVEKEKIEREVMGVGWNYFTKLSKESRVRAMKIAALDRTTFERW